MLQFGMLYFSAKMSAPASTEFDNGESINWFFHAISIDNILSNIIMDVLDKTSFVEWQVFPRLVSFCCEIRKMSRQHLQKMTMVSP